MSQFSIHIIGTDKAVRVLPHPFLSPEEAMRYARGFFDNRRQATDCTVRIVDEWGYPKWEHNVAMDAKIEPEWEA
jgi:hypothetical protein